MKPAYWIAIFALLGGILGYIIFRSTGWIGAGSGVVIGILMGVLIYTIQTRKGK